MPRILEKLTIREVSSVDRGAGDGVKVLLMKRDDQLTAEALYDLQKAETLPSSAAAYLKRTFTAEQRREAARSGAAMSDGSYPIENATDLHDAIHAIGRGKNNSHAAIRRHIVSRARALGLTSELPNDWKVSKGWMRKLLEGLRVAKATDFDAAQADVETGEYARGMLDEFGEAINSLAASITSIMCDEGVTDKKGAVDATIAQFQEHVQGVVPEGIENAMRGAALAAAGYELNDQGAIVKKEGHMAETEAERKAREKAEDLEKQLIVSKREIALLKMSQKHRDYMSARGDGMKQDERDRFADMSAEERDAHMSKNPVPEDTEKRIQEEVAKRIAADPSVVSMRKQLDEMQKREQVSELRKSWSAVGCTEPQIETLLKSFDGGTSKDVLAEMAKQFGALTAQVREAGLFKEFGSTASDGSAASDPHSQLMAKAHELRKAHPELTIEQAYAKAYEDPANSEIAKRERAQGRGRIYSGIAA